MTNQKHDFEYESHMIYVYNSNRDQLENHETGCMKEEAV